MKKKLAWVKKCDRCEYLQSKLDVYNKYFDAHGRPVKYKTLWERLKCMAKKDGGSSFAQILYFMMEQMERDVK